MAIQSPSAEHYFLGGMRGGSGGMPLLGPWPSGKSLILKDCGSVVCCLEKDSGAGAGIEFMPNDRMNT